jgi:hypothetical protein
MKCVYLFASTLVDDGGTWRVGNIIEKKNSDKEPEYFDKRYDIYDDDIPARFQNIYFIFSWRGLRVQIRFYLHNEYLSISVYVDLSLVPTGGCEPTSDIYKSIAGHMKKINDVCNERYGSMLLAAKNERHWPAETEKARQDLADTHKFFYEEFWHIFDDEMLYGALSTEKELEFLRYRLGCITFDSRGLVLHCPTRDDVFCSAPFHVRSRQTLRNSLAMNEEFDDEKAVYHTDTILPLLGATNLTEDPRYLLNPVRVRTAPARSF